MAPLHCWVLAHNRHNWGHMTHLKCCRPGPRLWEMLQSLEAACWHCQLPVRTDKNWQRKHRPGPGTGHWPSQGHRAVCGVVLSGLSFYVTTARRCVQDSGSTTSAAKYAKLATPWVRNQKLKTLPLRASTHRHPPPLHPTTFYPRTLTHVLGNLSLNIFIRTSKNCTLSFNLDRTTHSPSNNGQSTLEVHIY